MDAPRVPVREWTDEEWLMAIRDLPPETPCEVAEAFVALYRRSSTSAWMQLEQAVRGLGNATFAELCRRLWRIP